MTRPTTHLFSTLVLFVGATAAPAEDRNLYKLAHELRQELPEGWTLNATEHHWIVCRDEPVAFYSAVNSPGFDSDEEFQAYVKEHSVLDDFLIVFRFGPKVTPKQYEALQRHNRQAREKLEELGSSLRGITRKFDDFLPSNDEEKKRVADYRAAAAEIQFHELPDFHHDRHSVYIEDTKHWSWSMADEKVAAECARVRELATREFGKYEE